MRIAHDELGNVYGCGNSESEALEDARQWVDDPSNLAGIICSECTDALVRYVEEHGGQDVLVNCNNGIWDVPVEVSDAP